MVVLLLCNLTKIEPGRLVSYHSAERQGNVLKVCQKAQDQHKLAKLMGAGPIQSAVKVLNEGCNVVGIE